VVCLVAMLNERTHKMGNPDWIHGIRCGNPVGRNEKAPGLFI